MHHLEILGEACRGLSRDFRNTYPDDLWSDVVSLRNVFAHQYFGIDFDAVWEVVVSDLPGLKEKVLQVLDRPAEAGDAL